MAARSACCRSTAISIPGILIRTTYLRDGYATYPAGATLLYDSDPASEEAETRVKATGFFRLLGEAPVAAKAAEADADLQDMKLLLVDNDDCFIHTLANYARQAGAEVVTYRAGTPFEVLDAVHPDMILISPGPGRPEDFGVPQLVKHAAQAGIPVFGVCLGLQGIVEAFGGELGVLPYPMHGKPSKVRHSGQGVFEGLPDEIEVGRYHSLYAIPERLPASLEVTAQTEDGTIMGVRHRELPIEAVQFHPESILTAAGETGLKMMRNALRLARTKKPRGPMKVILFGATGMIGQGVLRECLLASDVELVETVGREATGVQNPKVREVVHREMLRFCGDRTRADRFRCVLLLPRGVFGGDERGRLRTGDLRDHDGCGGNAGAAESRDDVRLCFGPGNRQLGKRPRGVGADQGQDRKRAAAIAIQRRVHVPAGRDSAALWREIEDGLVSNDVRRDEAAAHAATHAVSELHPDDRADRAGDAGGGAAGRG